jgi:hypothetical protein
VWRAKDANNYYVTRANALEDNVVLYKTVNGVRSPLDIVGRKGGYGSNVKVPADTGIACASTSEARASACLSTASLLEVEVLSDFIPQSGIPSTWRDIDNDGLDSSLPKCGRRRLVAVRPRTARLMRLTHQRRYVSQGGVDTGSPGRRVTDRFGVGADAGLPKSKLSETFRGRSNDTSPPSGNDKAIDPKSVTAGPAAGLMGIDASVPDVSERDPSKSATGVELPV